MIVTRAFIPWPLEALPSTAAGRAEEGALAVGRIPADVKGLFLDRAALWTGEDLAHVRALTRESGGFGAVLTHSSQDSAYGAALFFAGHLLERHEDRHWERFARWVQLLGGPSLPALAEAAAAAPRDREWRGAADPGPPPPSSRVLLFASAEEASAAAAALGALGWESARPTEELLLARGPRLPPLEQRRALAAAHVRGAAWSLSGDGPPELLEDLHRQDVHPLPASGEGLLRLCATVANVAGVPAGVVAMPATPP